MRIAPIPNRVEAPGLEPRCALLAPTRAPIGAKFALEIGGKEIEGVLVRTTHGDAGGANQPLHVRRPRKRGYAPDRRRLFHETSVFDDDAWLVWRVDDCAHAVHENRVASTPRDELLLGARHANALSEFTHCLRAHGICSPTVINWNTGPATFQLVPN